MQNKLQCLQNIQCIINYDYVKCCIQNTNVFNTHTAQIVQHVNYDNVDYLLLYEFYIDNHSITLMLWPFSLFKMTDWSLLYHLESRWVAVYLNWHTIIRYQCLVVVVYLNTHTITRLFYLGVVCHFKMTQWLRLCQTVYSTQIPSSWPYNTTRLMCEQVYSSVYKYSIPYSRLSRYIVFGYRKALTEKI